MKSLIKEALFLVHQVELNMNKNMLRPKKLLSHTISLTLCFFPERLGEGRFLGAVSLSSMT